NPPGTSTADRIRKMSGERRLQEPEEAAREPQGAREASVGPSLAGGRLDAQSRTRVVWVAAIAALVMGGVVATALAFKGPADEGTTSGTRPRTAHAGPARADRPFTPPEGCEVDPKTPPELRIDLPDHRLDVGPVRQGVRIERDVTVRNVGTGTLC